MKLEFKKLGDIATFINGYAFKPTDWEQSGKAIIRIQNLNNDNAEFNYFSGDINEKYIVKKGDILISWSASIGVYEWNKEDALLNQHIFKVDFNKEEINKIYFKHMVSIALNKATQFMHGSTMKHITKKYFDDIKIPVPSLEIQKNIADILDKAKSLTSKRKEQIEELDLLVKSKFIEMFGNPLNNPKGWKEATLDYYTNLVTYGLTVRPNYIEEGIPLISAKEIRSGVVCYDSAPKISMKDYNKLSDKGKPKKYDILFSKTGSIGHCALVDSDEIFAITQNAARISLNLDNINPLWCLYYLRTDYIQEWCQKKSKGNAVKDFQLQDMKKIPIFICEKNIQNQFEDFVKQVDKLKLEMKQSLKELEDNFNSLIQKAFKGELFN